MSSIGTFPQEILTDVLSRLPIKSLCRFKCVSPSWNSLISHPHFAKTHLNRTNTQNLPKYLISTSHDLYSVDFTDLNPTATKLDFSLKNPVKIWSSCNGLLLVSHQEGDSFGPNVDLFLWNPASRERKKLPKIPVPLNSVAEFGPSMYGIGYDPFTDDYKAVMLSSYYDDPCFGFDNAFVVIYSLKTNAWRRIRDPHYVMMDSSCGVFLNECLHFRCWGPNSYKYVGFHLSDEVFREVPLPACSDNPVDVYYPWMVLGDCLCLDFSQRSGQVEVWMMGEYGVRESWTKLAIDLPGKFAVKMLCLLGENEYLLKANGVIRGRVYEEKLVVYDPKKETMRDMVVCGIPAKFTFGVAYVESLISPHHGGGIGRQ